MLIGRSTEGSIELDKEEMFQHMAIIGAGEGNNTSSKFLTGLLNEHIKANHGALIIQMEDDEFKNNVKSKLESAKRGIDFLELTEQHSENLLEVLFEAVDGNRIIYLKLADKSSEFIQRFNKAMESYLEHTCIRMTRRRSGRSPFLVIINQLEQNICPLWIKFQVWFRKINFMLIGSISGFDSIVSAKEDKQMFYQMGEFIDFAHTKVVFAQSSHSQNDTLAEYIGLPKNLKASGLNGFLGTSNKKESLLSRVDRKSAVVFLKNEYFAVNY